MKQKISKKTNKKRSIKIIGIVIAIIIFLSLIAYLLYIKQEKEITFQVLAAGQYNSINTSILKIMQYQFELDQLWEESFKVITPIPETPTINFKESTVIAFFLGQKSEFGWNIEIINVIERYDSVTVSIRQVPPTQIINSGRIANPYKIIKLDKIDKPIKIRIYE